MISIPHVVLIVLIALMLGIILGSLSAGLSLRNKTMGEALVANAIEKYVCRPHILLNNVTLPIAGGGTTQIDHVLVADTGIFIIETKHYCGWIYGDPNQSHWTQVIFKKKSKFQNPIRQNYAHLKAIQSLFTLPSDNFFALVVFTSDAEFKTSVGPSVVKLDGLIRCLTAERSVLFDERKMAYIVGRVEMRRMRHSLETDEYHLNYIRQKAAKRTAHQRF